MDINVFMIVFLTVIPIIVIPLYILVIFLMIWHSKTKFAGSYYSLTLALNIWDFLLVIRYLGLFGVCRIERSCPHVLWFNVFMTSFGWYTWVNKNFIHICIAINRTGAIVFWQHYGSVFTRKVTIVMILTVAVLATIAEVQLLCGYFVYTKFIGNRLRPWFLKIEDMPKWPLIWAKYGTMGIGGVTGAAILLSTVICVLYLRLKSKTSGNNGNNAKTELKLSIQALVISSGSLLSSGFFLWSQYYNNDFVRAAVEITMLISHSMNPIVLLTMDKNVKMSVKSIWQLVSKKLTTNRVESAIPITQLTKDKNTKNSVKSTWQSVSSKLTTNAVDPSMPVAH